MLTEPLPATLEIRKAALRGARASGMLKTQELQRFQALLAADDGLVEAQFRFFRDEEERYVASVRVEAQVTVLCQRCLEPMMTTVSSDSTLGIVFNDEQAVALPKHLEPLLVAEQSCNLWDVVEDELILALPPFSYHDTATCNAAAREFGEPVDEMPPAGDKANPFDVLAQLKPGEKE